MPIKITLNCHIPYGANAPHSIPTYISINDNVHISLIVQKIQWSKYTLLALGELTRGRTTFYIESLQGAQGQGPVID